MLGEALSDSWVALSKEKNKDTFSELDVLLRAIDRFFNIENLPLSKEDIANKNFVDELMIVRDVILRIVGLLEIVIPEHKRNVYWFQKFALAKYLNDKKRDAFREELYKQDVPEKSLLLLYDSFINLKGIVTDILKSETIPYLTFTNIAQLTGKDLRENIHFNPFKKDIDPDFDVIENRTVSRVVKGIREKEAKKCISVLLLFLFKFLRYLHHADSSSKFGSLHSSFVIILLLRLEIALFRAYIEKISVGLPDESLRTLLTSISYQFAVEAKRVFQQELKDIFVNKSSPRLKGSIENSHGILKNLSEQSIIQIVQFFKPDVKGSEIFESFMTKHRQSLRLREDLLILHRFLTLMDEQASAEGRLRIFGAMRNFMFYFQSFTFRLLRYDDYVEFTSFFDKTLTCSPDNTKGKNVDRLLGRISHFRLFIETCLRHLANRAELLDRPADMERVEASVNQYLH